MKQIKSANYDYSLPQQKVVVVYTDGTTDTFTSPDKLLEVQKQLQSQQRQILMESKT